MKHWAEFFLIIVLTLGCKVLKEEDKPQGQIDVRNFGAKADDGKDDTDAIQKAFNYASENKVDLFFPNGTYLIGKQLFFPSNLSVVGENREKTILKRKDQMKQNWTYAKGKSNIYLKSIGFDGSESTQPLKAYSTTLRFDACANIVVDDCYFTATGERATDFRACKNVVIKNSYFYNCGTANPDGNEGNAISVDVLNQNKETGLYSSNILVENCLFEKFGDTAIGCPQGDSITVINNKIYGRAYFGEKPLKFECGISLNGATNCVVRNNEMHYLRDFGIACISRGFGINPWVTGNLVIEDNIINHVQKPIRVEGRPKEKLYSENIQIRRNKLSNCAGSLWLRYYVRNSVIEDNVFENFGVVNRKKFYESYATIRLYDVTDIKVANNKFTKKEEDQSWVSHCIYINGDLCKNVEIQDNVYTDFKKTKVGIASNVKIKEKEAIKKKIK